ncbi:MAG: hypothetical protein O8C55_12315, partial [Candidatus Methanoperedens sp.]|nr:hypothetical protein [Candidatus Methanoperedens sp.]
LLGIETLDFITLSKQVSIQTYKNEQIKQIELRESYRLRLNINQIGSKEYIDRLVRSFENELTILKGGDS